jgi:GAF domain-containing protein
MARQVTALDDPKRLGVLRSFETLATQPEPVFDRLAQLAAHICGTPYAAISFVDGTGPFYKATVGFTDDGAPGAFGFCSDAVRQSDVFVVADAGEDERFASHHLVTGPPHVRFYAGAPLFTEDGHALGTLCVLDRVPRRLAKEQTDALVVLASEVVTELELRRMRKALVQGTLREDSFLLARY